MPLQPFRIASAELSASITMDASTVEGTTVTVAVAAMRAEEPDILRAIYEHAEAHNLDFKPFYHKANDFEYHERSAFSEALIHDQYPRLAAFAHEQPHDGNTDTEQVEAVHSAIHVDDLLAETETPLIIVDGNEQQAVPFVRALSGLRAELPAIGHCLQSEYYYPTAVLADLTSNYLAHSINRGEYDPTDPILPAPRAKQSCPEWGQVFNAMYQERVDYTPPDLQNRRGDTVRERICCWYDGAMALDSGADRPLSDSLNPVISALRRGGYDEVAATLEEL